MRQRAIIAWILFAVLGAASLAGCGKPKLPDTIKVGVLASITGSIPNVGQSTVNAAQLAVKEVNDAGGLDVNGQKVQIELVIEDDQDRKETAVSAAKKLINRDGVAAIVGPQASRDAIPAAVAAEEAGIPLISPWSTAAETTAGKKYVFRTAFIDPFQGRVMARFAIETLHAQTAAVLYDVASDYNKGIAEIFKNVFTDAGGRVVAFESYTTGETDFARQLAAIKVSNADVLFLPNYYDEVPLQVRQAREAGIESALIGSDTWGGISSSDLARMGAGYYSTHYSPDTASPTAQRFITLYKSTYGSVPDDVAALTYDAFGILFQAITSQGKLDPESIRNGLAGIRQYEGVTGTMDYQGTGDPVKSAVIMAIKDGKVQFYDLAKP